jgi:hypothetical protein
MKELSRRVCGWPDGKARPAGWELSDQLDRVPEGFR